MLIRRGDRYRIYPTPAQVERLAGWEGALRWLWNHCHTERLAKLEAGYAVPTAFDQINDLKALRAGMPWLADVPRDVCAQLLVELDKAWQRGFKKLSRMPRYKSKMRGDRAPLIAPQGFRVEGDGRDGVLVFPKLGPVRTVVHRVIHGKAKTCAVVRDGDRWYACVSHEAEIADPAPNTKSPIALDVGVAKLVADSNGGFVENPRHAEKLQARVRRAQRVVARRQKGSKNQQKARAKVAKLHRKIRHQREHTLHTASSRYAKNHGVILVEALNIRCMTASASGSIEEPGTRVAQKRGLNRAILGTGWGRFRQMLQYKVVLEGGQVIERPAAYSSQEDAACGHTDPASRRSQSLFVCTACGNTNNADTNAAQVLLVRWMHETAVEPTVAVCGGSAAQGRPTKQKLRVARRGTRPDESAGAHGVTSKAPAFRPG